MKFDKMLTGCVGLSPWLSVPQSKVLNGRGSGMS